MQQLKSELSYTKQLITDHYEIAQDSGAYFHYIIVILHVCRFKSLACRYKRVVVFVSALFILSHIHTRMFFFVTVTASNGPRFFTELSSMNVQGAKHISSFLLNGQQIFSVIDSTGNVHLVKAAFVSEQYHTIQTIIGKYADSTTAFVINDETYLALACSGESTVLKHNGREFVDYQTFPPHVSLSVAFVSISSVDPVKHHHLLVFSTYSYRTRYDLPSYVYRWNNSTQHFDTYQSLPSTGATNIRFFFTDHELHLAIACSINGTKTVRNHAFSQVYVWRNSAFSLLQQLPVPSAQDLYPMVIGCHTFLIISTNSASYVYYKENLSFKEHSFSLPLNTLPRLQHFRIKSEHFVAVANQTTTNIYLITGKSFQYHQSLSVPSPSFLYFPHFQTSSQPILLVANKLNSIKVFKWKHVDETCN